MKVPLYQKISDELKERILSHNLTVGDQLPTESELSHKYNVSRITAKRALTELEQLGLVTRTRGKGTFVKDNSIEKLMRGPNDKRVLFVIPFEGISFGNFTTSLVPLMQAEGITLFITYSNYLEENSPKTIHENFDGLIYYPLHTVDFLDVLMELSLHNFPVVVLDKKIIDLPFPCVYADNFEGGAQAAKLLIDQGHQRIAYLLSDETHHPHTTRNRYLGYVTMLKENKLEFHTTLHDNMAVESQVVNLIRSHAITALVCENDLVALQAMNILQTNGYIVPKDISIIGFDNIQATQLSNPALTTIAQNFDAMGEIAGRLLIDWMKSGKTPEDVKIPIQLIKRASTASIK